MEVQREPFARLPLWNFSNIGGTIFLTFSKMSLVAEDIWGDSVDIRVLLQYQLRILSAATQSWK